MKKHCPLFLFIFLCFPGLIMAQENIPQQQDVFPESINIDPGEALSIPTIACPANIVKNNDAGMCSRFISYIGSPLTDNCGACIATNNSPGTFPVGETIVTWVVSDNGGNTSSCTQRITIVDYQFPALNCPANIYTLNQPDQDCGAVVDFAAVATDNCPGVSVEYSQASHTFFPMGGTNIRTRATDAAGHWVDCVFQVWVKPRAEVCNGLDDDCDGDVDEVENWQQTMKSLASDGGLNQLYGDGVALYGDWAVVGSQAPDALGQLAGAAYLLRRNASDPNVWDEVLKLQPADLEPGTSFGAKVAIQEGIVAVSAPYDGDGGPLAGAVYIFYQNAGNANQWDLVKKLTGLSAFDVFGNSLALSNDYLLGGVWLDDEAAQDAGAALLFERNKGGSDNWGFVKKLLAADADKGEYFGAALALDGEIALVSAPGDDQKGLNAGAAYVFGRDEGGPNNWGQVKKITAADGKAGDNFGVSVALDDPFAIVGANQDDDEGSNSGTAFIFNKNHHDIPNSWGQERKLWDFFGKAQDEYGYAVAISDQTVAVGARNKKVGVTKTGAAFIYQRVDANWNYIDQLTDDGGQLSDYFGSTLAMSGLTLLAGAPQDDADATTDQGSASFFEGLCQPSEERSEPQTASVLSDKSVRCYPVPFSDLLNIELNLLEDTEVNVSVFNTMGSEVATIYNGPAGHGTVLQWRNAALPAGAYIVRVETGNQVITRSVVLVRE